MDHASPIETGPFAPVIGGGVALLAGTGAGIAGHIGGTKATRKMLQWTAKDMLMQFDLKPVLSARKDLDKQIARLQEIPPLPTYPVR